MSLLKRIKSTYRKLTSDRPDATFEDFELEIREVGQSHVQLDLDLDCSIPKKNSSTSSNYNIRGDKNE